MNCATIHKKFFQQVTRPNCQTPENIKLQEGDTLTLHIIGIGHPIYAKDIVRGGEHIPAYEGAKKGGLRSFRHIPAP